MKFNCKPNELVLSLDTCDQIEIILNAVQFAALNPLVDDASCIAVFDADRLELRQFSEELNVAINPEYRKGSSEAAFKAKQQGK